MSTFIKNHLVEKIKSEVKLKQTILQSEGFLYLDNEITQDRKKFNRINDSNIFEKEQILPYDWNLLNPHALLQIYTTLKDNNFYTYREIRGNFQKLKVRLKK
jgi:hypothetical protein